MDAKQWPPHKYALAELKTRELVKYGSEIPWELIEELFDSGPRSEWPFRTQYMKLCEALKDEGFWPSEARMNGLGIRLLNREEMADRVKAEHVKAANASLNQSLMLSKVPRENLSYAEVKKLDHWETKAAVIGATAKVLLRRRSLPTPTNVIKSITQLASEAPAKEEK